MKSKNTKKIFLAAVVCPLFILEGAGVAYQQLLNYEIDPDNTIPKVVAPLVSFTEVELISETLKVQSQGVVEPFYTTEITAIVGGQVLSIDPRLRSGGVFQKGEVMLQLNPIAYKAAQSRALASLRQSELNLKKIEAAAKQAALDWSRLGKGEGSELAFYKPQLLEVQADVEAARAEYDSAMQDVNNTTILAPYNCRVEITQVSPGQSLVVGDVVAKVFSIDAAEIRLPVRDEELALLSSGAWRSIEASADSGRVILSAKFGERVMRWDAHVVRSEGVVHRENQMIYLVAKVLEPYEKELPMGLFVKANIYGRVADNVFKIPARSLVDGAFVYTIDSENHIHKKSVSVIQHREENVLVSSGLVAGDKLCTSSLDYFFEGMQVRTKTDQFIAGVANE